MDIKRIKEERSRWMSWKNIKPLRDALLNLPQVRANISYGDTVSLSSDLIDSSLKELIYETAKLMKPWRKGPFKVFDLYINTEWRSNIKYNMLEPFFELDGKVVADIGCNNGYYMFRMLQKNPKKIIGFDPSPLYKTQFDFINHFAQTDIEYELLGVEHVEFYSQKFDTIFCLGVLYHRSDPVGTLKSLRRSLNSGGELIIDTFMIDGEEQICLTPSKSYSKIPNIYFIPTVSAMKNWCERAGFSSFELLATSLTSLQEQRKTEWIDTQSLENFLNEHDKTKTVEGYPAPKRMYVKVRA